MDKKKQLIIAILIFVLAFLGTQYYVDSEIAQYKDKKLVKVVRAKKSIKQGELLSASNVEQAEIPELYVPKAKILWSEQQQFLQLPLATDILAGDYVLKTSFATVGIVGRTLSQQLEAESYRAITIPVDENNSLARSIVAGDRIDIVFTFGLPSIREKITTLLLQNIPVVSTGSYSAASQELGESNKIARYNTLTLKLSANDAMRLNYAKQVGNISLMLRSVQDDKIIDLAPLTSVQDVLSLADKNVLDKLTQLSKQNIQTAGEKAEAMMREQAKAVLEMQKKQSQVTVK